MTPEKTGNGFSAKCYIISMTAWKCKAQNVPWYCSGIRLTIRNDSCKIWLYRTGGKTS